MSKEIAIRALKERRTAVQGEIYSRGEFSQLVDAKRVVHKFKLEKDDPKRTVIDEKADRIKARVDRARRRTEREGRKLNEELAGVDELGSIFDRLAQLIGVPRADVDFLYRIYEDKIPAPTKTPEEIRLEVDREERAEREAKRIPRGLVIPVFSSPPVQDEVTAAVTGSAESEPSVPARVPDEVRAEEPRTFPLADGRIIEEEWMVKVLEAARENKKRGLPVTSGDVIDILELNYGSEKADRAEAGRLLHWVQRRIKDSGTELMGIKGKRGLYLNEPEPAEQVPVPEAAAGPVEEVGPERREEPEVQREEPPYELLTGGVLEEDNARVMRLLESTGGYVSRDDIAAHLGVSRGRVKTVMNGLRGVLEGSGYEITGKRGNRGGFRLEKPQPEDTTARPAGEPAAQSTDVIHPPEAPAAAVIVVERPEPPEPERTQFGEDDAYVIAEALLGSYEGIKADLGRIGELVGEPAVLRETLSLIRPSQPVEPVTEAGALIVGINGAFGRLEERLSSDGTERSEDDLQSGDKEMSIGVLLIDLQRIHNLQVKIDGVADPVPGTQFLREYLVNKGAVRQVRYKILEPSEATGEQEAGAEPGVPQDADTLKQGKQGEITQRNIDRIEAAVSGIREEIRNNLIKIQGDVRVSKGADDEDIIGVFPDMQRFKFQRAVKGSWVPDIVPVVMTKKHRYTPLAIAALASIAAHIVEIPNGTHKNVYDIVMQEAAKLEEERRTGGN